VIEVAAPPVEPAAAARRAAGGAFPFWLTSPGASDDVAIAADFVGCDPVRVVRGDVDELEEAWRAERRQWAHGGGAPAGLPIGVGWLSYDLGRRWIALPARARDDHGWADLEMRFHDAVWTRDAATGAARIVARDDAAARRLAARLAGEGGRRDDVPPPPPVVGPLDADQPADAYFAAVRRILEYLRAGDAYQVNLARRLAADVAPGGDPVWMAAALRARAPAPHAAWIASEDGRDYVVGNSPERFLRADGRGGVETRPIKGTRPRGAGGARDAAARRELGAAAKERAEHVMIVDLERNDLGRVCRPGSIRVESPARIVDLPTVFHMVTTVRGQLRADVGLADLLRATFPGGSITGAPKRRAMEIIEELEPVRRGPYTGATGWLGAAGDLDFAVAIRTALVRGGRLHLSVGGGIVADSSPEAELAETEAKARAFRALCGGGDGAAR
jgi:para-aminobenzoate synthetase component 1